ncbi:hypothetical protein HanIR_Chr06g0259261 [Helianthus annuus]|nr:hypothetical protein HanIR_Chr06g0259261 [Helianthus annuus]
MGFPDRWCRWIYGILESARASVLVNGAPTIDFHRHKGMRQCDLISSFLFLIVMEALSCMFDKAVEGILTLAALRKRNIEISDRIGEEMVDHLFTGCVVASVLWQTICVWCKISNLLLFSFRDILEAHEVGGS